VCTEAEIASWLCVSVMEFCTSGMALRIRTRVFSMNALSLPSFLVIIFLLGGNGCTGALRGAVPLAAVLLWWRHYLAVRPPDNCRHAALVSPVVINPPFIPSISKTPPLTVSRDPLKPIIFFPRKSSITCEMNVALVRLFFPLRTWFILFVTKVYVLIIYRGNHTMILKHLFFLLLYPKQLARGPLETLCFPVRP